MSNAYNQIDTLIICLWMRRPHETFGIYLIFRQTKNLFHYDSSRTIFHNISFLAHNCSLKARSLYCTMSAVIYRNPQLFCFKFCGESAKILIFTLTTTQNNLTSRGFGVLGFWGLRSFYSQTITFKMLGFIALY